MGNVKQGIGKLVGSDGLQSQGATQKLKGDAQRAAAHARPAAKLRRALVEGANMGRTILRGQSVNDGWPNLEE
jgi:uncharacterized protein YjbJ (UPF0337 family)